MIDPMYDPQAGSSAAAPSRPDRGLFCMHTALHGTAPGGFYNDRSARKNMKKYLFAIILISVLALCLLPAGSSRSRT